MITSSEKEKEGILMRIENTSTVHVMSILYRPMYRIYMSGITILCKLIYRVDELRGVRQRPRFVRTDAALGG